MHFNFELNSDLKIKKSIAFFTYFLYYGVCFLILNEQLRRLSFSPYLSIIATLLVLIAFSYLLKKLNETDDEQGIDFIETKKNSDIVSTIGYLLLIVFFIIISYPIIKGDIQFELSVDSILYHLQAIHSLSSFYSPYALNDAVVIYARTFLRVGEALNALFNLIFYFLTPLQAQVGIFFVLYIFSYCVTSKLLGSVEALVLHLVILCVPTVFLQLQTNYVDILEIPLSLITISLILLAKTKKDYLVAIMWLALLAGIKTHLLLISGIIVIFSLIYKKISIKPNILCSVILLISLPTLPILIANYIEFLSPIAPYSLFIFPGIDVMSTNLIPNRPEIFWHEPFQSSGIYRFIYATFIAFKSGMSYDSRLGGGGFIFPITLISYFILIGYKSELHLSDIRKVVKINIKQVISTVGLRSGLNIKLNSTIGIKCYDIMSMCTPEFRKNLLTNYRVNFANHQIVKMIRFLKQPLRTELFLFVLFILSLLVTPENYWFRYIIVSFSILVIHLFYKISKMPNQVKVMILILFVGLAMSQFFITKAAIVSTAGFDRNFDNFMSYSHQRPEMNDNFKEMKEFIRGKNKFIIVMNDVDFYNFVGNYVAATSPYAEIHYSRASDIKDISKLLENYETVIYTGENLTSFYEKYKDMYDAFSIRSDVQPDGVILVKR